MSLAVHDRLKEIELDNCPLITDASLHYLKDCRTLERVELYDCQLITRAGIRNFRVTDFILQIFYFFFGGLNFHFLDDRKINEINYRMN